MCGDCYERYGSPVLTGPNVDRAEELIRVIYDHSGVGEPFHVELDDWNLREGPWEPWWSDDISEYDREHVAAAEELGALVADMTVEAIASALARFDGYAADTAREARG